MRICCSQFKCNYLKNENHFLNFLFHFWNLHQNLNILEKKIIVIANVFPKLQIVKDLVRPISKKCHFRTPFDSKHVKDSQTLVQSGWETFYHVFSSLWGEMISKKCPSVKFEILGVLGSTLTVDDKDPLPDFENLRLQIQMQLSLKRKSFFPIFYSISWIYSKFLTFSKEVYGHSECISEITDCQRFG